MKKRASCSENAGMTLVELLVAITMLAIIVVPLLHAFGTSAVVGMKARHKLRATTAAQDIMEGLKAESVQSLATSFNYPDDAYDESGLTPITTAPNSFQNFWLVSPTLVGGKDSGKLYELTATAVEEKSSSDYRSLSSLQVVSGTTLASSMRKADNSGYDFFPKTNGKYFFAIENFCVESDAGTKDILVDAIIELDGSNYTATGVAPKASTGTGENHALLNDYSRVNFSQTDEKRDAFFIEDPLLTTSTVQEFNTTYIPTPSCGVNDLHKEIVVEVVNHSAAPGGDTAVDGKDWITVECSITYRSTGAFMIPSTHPNYDTTLGGNQPYTKTYTSTIFDNKATGISPENVYVCYFPGYCKTAGVKDEIIFVNAESIPLSLHLVKQESANNGTLNSDEMRYTCQVTINEGNGATPEHKGTGIRKDSVTEVVTNLDYNLYRAYMESAPEVNQATYSYNNKKVNKSDKDAMIYPLGGKKEEDTAGYIYDVTIDLYPEGSLQNGITSGSMSGEDILFTLKGSM